MEDAAAGDAGGGRRSLSGGGGGRGGVPSVSAEAGQLCQHMPFMWRVQKALPTVLSVMLLFYLFSVFANN